MRRIIALLLIGAVVPAIGALVIAAAASLLKGMGDHGAAIVATWAAWILGILWVLDLMVLLLAVAIAQLSEGGQDAPWGQTSAEPIEPGPQDPMRSREE